MLRIELKPNHSGQPGYGELTVHHWPHGDEGLELTVQRNQDGRYLGADGSWGSNPVWHGVEGLSLSDDTLKGEVGPWLIDPLMLDPQMAYMLQLRDPDGSDKGVLRLLAGLLSSMAAGNSAHNEQKIKRGNTQAIEQDALKLEAKPEEPTELTLELDDHEPSLGDINATELDDELPALNAEPREPLKTSTAGAKKPNKLWLIILLLAVLIALAAALWWFVLRAPQSNTAATSSTASATSAAAACSSEALAEVNDDLAYIQSCVKSNPNSEQVLAVIAAAKEAKRCGVVQRLYAHKAQAGDAAVAFAYAREYDPESFTSGGCVPASDAETAAYWYEIAVTHDPANQHASQRLEALRK